LLLTSARAREVTNGSVTSAVGGMPSVTKVLVAGSLRVGQTAALSGSEPV